MSTPPLTLLMTPLTSLPLQPLFVSFQTLYFHDYIKIPSYALFLPVTPHLSLHIPVQPQMVSIQHCVYQCAHACACTCTCMYFISLGPRLGLSLLCWNIYQLCLLLCTCTAKVAVRVAVRQLTRGNSNCHLHRTRGQDHAR